MATFPKQLRYFPLQVCDVFCYQPGDFQQCSNSLLYQHQSELWLIVAPLVDFTAGEKEKVVNHRNREFYYNHLTIYNYLIKLKNTLYCKSKWILFFIGLQKNRKRIFCVFILYYTGTVFNSGWRNMESWWGLYSSPFPCSSMFYMSVNIVVYRQLAFRNSIANGSLQQRAC